MSVLVTIKVSGNTDTFRELLVSKADTFRAVGDEGKSLGAIHHRFGIGDGFIFVVDEWTSREAFLGFFQGNAEIPGIMAAAGAGEPEITFAEAIESPDQF